MTLTHEDYMQRCLDLALNGLGSTAPNPMVGSVMVNNERILGEGYHTGFGKPHAEVEAIAQVKNPALLTESTLYVNLEPCNHQGKTGPCTDLILEKGIRKVVIGQCDTNPVAGGGVERLRNHGVEVITGILENECRFLNRRFNTFHEHQRPYVILKWAQTTDGYVDSDRAGIQGSGPAWITDETCRRLVHKWRSEEQGILAGSQTILLDNPQLNVRSWSGRDPVRITIDRTGKILAGTLPTIVYTFIDQQNKPNLNFVRISPVSPVWPQVFSDLYHRNIQSVLIEGGPTLLNTLIKEDYWDEARVFIGPGWFGNGVKAPEFAFTPSEEEKIGNSRLLIFKRNGA